MKKLPSVCAALVVSFSFAIGAPPTDLADLLTDAQRTYIRGDLAGAKEKFDLVRKLEPNNRTAISYLRLIAADETAQQMGKNPPNAREASLKKLILDKVAFEDATLAEALEFLRQKGNKLGDGKAAINFVHQLDDPAKAAKITLKLQNVPFTEVLRYIGELAGVEFKYEPYAIVAKPKSSAQPASGNVGASQPQNRVKIDGL